MAETGLRRSRMWRAYWIRLLLQGIGFVGGMAAWLTIPLWRNGTLRALYQVARNALAMLDGVWWFIALSIGGLCAIFMLWVWAELMRRTHYLSKEELKEMTTKWVAG